MAENKEQKVSTETTDAATVVVAETVEPNEREARRGSRDRAPKGDRRERETEKSHGKHFLSVSLKNLCELSAPHKFRILRGVPVIRVLFELGKVRLVCFV